MHCTEALCPRKVLNAWIFFSWLEFSSVPNFQVAKGIITKGEAKFYLQQNLTEEEFGIAFTLNNLNVLSLDAVATTWSVPLSDFHEKDINSMD